MVEQVGDVCAVRRDDNDVPGKYSVVVVVFAWTSSGVCERGAAVQEELGVLASVDVDG